MILQNCELGDLLTLQRGYDITKNYQKLGEYPVVSSSGVASYHNEFKVKGPGVVIGRKGTLGSAYFITSDFWPHDTSLFVKDFKGNNKKYIYYLLKTLKLESLDVGSSNPSLNRNHVHKLKVNAIKDVTYQKKIASILSAYDDLIENNLKRIKLLEEAAQNIYKEWFVNFRFPEYESLDFKKDLPHGWVRVPLSELAEVIMGQSPSSEYFNIANEGLPFHQGVTNYGYKFVSNETYSSQITRIANEGDILCSVRAPVGRLNITLEKIVIGRGLSAIKDKGNNQSFLYYQLKSHFFQEDMIGGGSIFNSVTKKELEGQLLLSPQKEIVEEFERIVKPIDLQIKTLYFQNQKLNEARDILLPRLMNQTIEVT